jgi:hypothetical protein
MRTILVGLLLAVSVCVAAQKKSQPPSEEEKNQAQLAQNKIQPLNVKTGLWESTVTFTRSGARPLPADLLQRLSPEQRARMEERLKASSGGNAQTHTNKSCLTKEKLENGYELGFGKDENCTQTVVTSTSSKAEVHFICQHEKVNYSGIIRAEALSSENVKGSGDTTASDGEHTMNGTSTFTSKWLGSDCGDVK